MSDDKAKDPKKSSKASSEGPDESGVAKIDSWKIDANLIRKVSFKMVMGPGRINVNEIQLQKIPAVYAQALEAFSENISGQLKGRHVPEEDVKEINNCLNELAMEVEDIQPGKEAEVDYVKQTQVETKTASLIQRVLNVLPETAETATFTPLAPFSKLIGKGIRQIVDAIVKR